MIKNLFGVRGAVLAALPLAGALLCFSENAQASSCLIDFNSQALLDQFTDRAMASQMTAWTQLCQFVEPADVAVQVSSLNGFTELPFSNPTYDVWLWDGGGKGGCVLPAAGSTPAATSTFGNLGGGNGFGCDPTKAIFWNADTFPRYVSTHVPGQPVNWTQPISVSLIGVVSHFDLTSFKVVHGKVDLCTRDANSNTFVKPAGHTNIGVGVHNVFNVFDVFEVRFAAAGKPCENNVVTGTTAGVDDITITWN